MQIKLALSVARAALATVVTTAVLVGCSSGQLGGTGGTGSSFAGTGGIGGTGGAEPLEMFASDFQTAFCTPRVACGVFPDLATCEAFEGFADYYAIRNIIASARRGTVAYDPIAAAACIAALPHDCATTQVDSTLPLRPAAVSTLQWIAACISTFTATVPLGGSCRTYDLECVSPGFCYSTTNVCTGTCTAATGDLTPNSLGDDCTQNGWCLLPAICVGTQLKAVCAIPPGHLASCESAGCGYLGDYCGLAPGAATPTCLPRIAAGSPCTLGNTDAGVSVDPCVLDSQCVGGVCVPAYAPLGGACGDVGPQCFSGMVCSNGVCTTAPSSDPCTIPM